MAGQRTCGDQLMRNGGSGVPSGMRVRQRMSSPAAIAAAAPARTTAGSERRAVSAVERGTLPARLLTDGTR